MEGKGPPYDCDSCGYQTVFEANYLRHLETHELDPPRAFICHYCRFVTLDNKVFKKHLADHKNPGRLYFYFCRQLLSYFFSCFPCLSALIVSPGCETCR